MLQGRLRLVAAVVVNQPQEAFFCARLQRLGCEIFGSSDELWEKFFGRLDLCLIPTGLHLHASMTLRALRAGASVLVEKPLATSTDDAQAIMRLERETGRFVAVGFQDLYTDSTWVIKQQLLDGIIGKVKTVTFCGLWPRPTAYYRRNEWAGRLRHEGCLVLDSPVNNAFAHFLNLALFWSGPSTDASASVQSVVAELYRAHAIESFDTCCLRAKLSTNTELILYATHSCQEERVPKLRIEGTRGQIEWVQESHYEIVTRNGTRTRHGVPGKFETKLMMADAVFGRLENSASRICTTAIAFEHLRLVELMHAASPIVDISMEHVQRYQTPMGEWRAITGIESVVDRAATEHRLWSEMDVPWTRRLVPLSAPQSADVLKKAGGTELNTTRRSG